MTIPKDATKGHCCGSGCFGTQCSCPCEECIKVPSVLIGPDPLFTFSDAVLQNALEALWQFLGKRGAKETGYAKALERRLPLYYLGNRTEGEPGEVRMLRTTGDWDNCAWELEDRGCLFEIERGKVFWSQVKDQEKAREECFKLCFSIMAICGTKADYQLSISKPIRLVGPEEK